MKSAQMPIFDTLGYNQALVESGVPDKQAQAMTRAMEIALGQGVARREDIKDLTQVTTTEFAAVRSEMKSEFAAVRSEMASEFAAVRSEMASEFAAVRNEMKSEFAAVRSEMVTGFATAQWKFRIMYILLGLILALQASATPWAARILPFLK